MASAAILTLSQNGSLGVGDQPTFLWNCAEDKKWFRDVTKAIGTVVVGRKTFATFGGKPLQGRRHYIITSTPEQIQKTDEVIPLTLEDFRALRLETYVNIGGAQLLNALLPETRILYLSEHKKVVVDGPAFPLDRTDLVLFDRTESDDLTKSVFIRHPYTRPSFTYRYEDGQWLDAAQSVMLERSLDRNMPNGLVVVNNGVIVASGANGSPHHDLHGCERKRRNIPTGQGYDLCEGCHPKNHSEAKATNDGRARGVLADLAGGTAYLFGHWWACEPCHDVLEFVGIHNIVFSKAWTKKFFGIVC